MSESVVKVEQVLVVKSEKLEELGLLSGFSGDVTKLKDAEYHFENRDLAEKDESIKQIIPYCYLYKPRDLRSNMHDLYFVYRRTKKAGEKRLAELYSLGIGGHANPVDFGDDKHHSLMEIVDKCLEREISEEVKMSQRIRQVFDWKGVLYDNSNEVGRVHLGLIVGFQIPLYTEVALNEDALDSGQWWTKTELVENYDKMENWSKILIDKVI